MRSRRRRTSSSRSTTPSNTSTPPTCMWTGPRSAEIAETSEGERGSVAVSVLARSGLRPPGAVDRGAEDPVPVGSGDPVATGVVLEVVAHVELAQPAAEARARAVVMQRVMDHVVDQVAGEEAAAERERSG